MQINVNNRKSGAGFMSHGRTSVTVQTERLFITEAGDTTAFQSFAIDIYLPGGKFDVEVKP